MRELKEKAASLSARARSRARQVHGDSNRNHAYREYLLHMSEMLDAAHVLCDGPIEARNAHWRKRLFELVQRAEEEMG